MTKERLQELRGYLTLALGQDVPDKLVARALRDGLLDALNENAGDAGPGGRDIDAVLDRFHAMAAGWRLAREPDLTTSIVKAKEAAARRSAAAKKERDKWRAAARVIRARRPSRGLDDIADDLLALFSLSVERWPRVRRALQNLDAPD